MKWFFLIVVCVASAGLTLAWTRWSETPTTVTRLSPDETIRARLVERSRGPNSRTLTVRLEFLTTGRVVDALPRSPDQGGPEGTERLIWTRDGTKVLLVGRHFFVEQDLFLENGDQLFFLYDVKSARGWCNSSEPSGFNPLLADQVRGLEFTEPIVFRAIREP